MWRAQTPLPLEGDALEAACKLIDVLEDNDDVQNVWTNIVLEDA
jgi:transcriptional/translational regulatory protein YebC/TACO1